MRITSHIYSCLGLQGREGESDRGLGSGEAEAGQEEEEERGQGQGGRMSPEVGAGVEAQRRSDHEAGARRRRSPERSPEKNHLRKRAGANPSPGTPQERNRSRAPNFSASLIT